MARRLHVYVQQNGHDDMYIIGDRQALLALKDRIDHVLNNPVEVVSADMYTADGEGYDAYILNTEGENYYKDGIGEEYLWTNITYPYQTMEVNLNDDYIDPYTIIGQKRYNQARNYRFLQAITESDFDE